MATASALPSQECNCLALRRAARHTIQFYDQCLAPSRSSPAPEYRQMTS